MCDAIALVFYIYIERMPSRNLRSYSWEIKGVGRSMSRIILATLFRKVPRQSNQVGSGPVTSQCAHRFFKPTPRNSAFFRARRMT